MLGIGNKITQLKNDLMEYATMRIRLYKFEIVERIAIEKSGIITGVILWVVVLFLLLFAGLAAAMYLNEIYDSSYAGFGIVTLFWAVVLIFGLIFRKSIRKHFLTSYLDKNIPS